MHFGENQLSRSLIGLSPLPTAHPLSFQPKWVRSSTQSYLRFNLAMGRSLRFGSRPSDSKGTLSPHTPNGGRLQRIVGTRFQDLFHSPPGVLFTFPSRYLSAIGHQGIFRLSRWSCQIHTGFLGPRATWEIHRESTPFRLRGSHPLCRAIQCSSTMTQISHSLPACQHRSAGPTTPDMQRLTALTHARFSLIRFRSPLLTESLLFSLPVGTEMFHFPTFPPHTLYIQVRVTGLASSRVSPFGNPRITVWLSTTRGLSQIPTSFFGSWCQGIHRVPLKT
jgi:hypothetical protein